MRKNLFLILSTLGFAIVLFLNIKDCHDEKVHNEQVQKDLSELQLRVKNSCVQTASTLALMSHRMKVGAVDDTTELAAALTYGAPSVWLCTGHWPDLDAMIGHATKEEIQTEIDRLVVEVDPDRNASP